MDNQIRNDVNASDIKDATSTFIQDTNIREQNSEKKSTKSGIFRQALLTANVSLVMISLAQILVYPALLLPQMRNETDILYMNSEAGSWFTSINSLSSPVGSIIAGILMDKYGRRIALATPLIPLIASWIATAMSTNFITLFGSRIVLGFCGGFAPCVCQIYLAESADPEFRGITMNIGYVTLTTGMLLTFALGLFMDWRMLAWCGIVLPIISLLTLPALPETPAWLALHGRIDNAYKNLCLLRGDKTIARNELNQYLARREQEKSNTNSVTWKDYKKSSVLKPIVIIFSFILLFNLSGTYLMFQYALDIMSQITLTMSPKETAVCLSAVRLLVTLGFCVLFMHVARRKIYMMSGIVSTLSTILLAGYLFNIKKEQSVYDVFIPSALLLIYVASNTGFMIAPGFMTGELLPVKIRGRLAGAIYTFFSVVTFALNKMFPLCNEHIGLVGVLFVFGIASLATTLLVYFLVPETKGKSLLQIEEHFQHCGWVYKATRS